MASEPTRARILIADDETAVARSLARLLDANGYDVELASDGKQAAHLAKQTNFDVIVSDIQMPGLNGIELLRMVRDRDMDVPVVLMTGDPKVETAVNALELGALQYLLKPVDMDHLCKTVEKAVLLHRMARAKREAMEFIGNLQARKDEKANLRASFERALQGLWTAFQPIIRWADRSIFGYEALLRTNEPSFPNPHSVLQAAEQLERLHDLGRCIREHTALTFADAPKEALLFVNLDPYDLLDANLYDANAPLSRIAQRTVLEITERAAMDHISDVRMRMAELRHLGFRIALDDLGAGYAGLNSFVLLEPEFVKLDMTLVRNVHKFPVKQKLIRSMASVCEELGITVIAEGVETPAECEAVLPLGCSLVQGYLFARPGPPFPRPNIEQAMMVPAQGFEPR